MREVYAAAASLPVEEQHGIIRRWGQRQAEQLQASGCWRPLVVDGLSGSAQDS
jgi:hypothetical protein